MDGGVIVVPRLAVTLFSVLNFILYGALSCRRFEKLGKGRDVSCVFGAAAGSIGAGLTCLNFRVFAIVFFLVVAVLVSIATMF